MSADCEVTRVSHAMKNRRIIIEEQAFDVPECVEGGEAADVDGESDPSRVQQELGSQQPVIGPDSTRRNPRS